jgi:hypothetical protein
MPPPGKQNNEADSRTSHEKRTITKRFQKHEVAVAVHKNTPMNETIIGFAIALATVIPGCKSYLILVDASTKTILARNYSYLS